jgi:hypothetical protein
MNEMYGRPPQEPNHGTRITLRVLIQVKKMRRALRITHSKEDCMGRKTVRERVQQFS